MQINQDNNESKKLTKFDHNGILFTQYFTKATQFHSTFFPKTMVEVPLVFVMQI